MKKYLILLLLSYCIYAFGQVKPGYVPPLVQAKNYLDKSNHNYNPSKAFEIYKQFAEYGSPIAMNCLAILYYDGIGTGIDRQIAIKWFEESAKRGYPQSFYNLGNLYRTGYGVEQDFVKAYQWFEKGVALNSGNCMYEQGYLLYKGFGTSQNYQKSISLFRKGIKLNNSSCMYMLGLCFRNGYGMGQNIDSARYWLGSSAARGYPLAVNELSVSEPENKNIKPKGIITETSNSFNKASKVLSQDVWNNLSFQKIEQNLDSKNITGNYTGFIIHYDFSGQHVIESSILKMNINSVENVVNGNWIENGYPSISFNGVINDTSLVFNNTTFEASDHYSIGKKINYQFKNAKLLVIKKNDSVYLVGNLQLWSVTRSEPEKPIYISLTRNESSMKKPTSNIDTIKNVNSLLSKLQIFPNPFINSFQLHFSLNQQCNVEIRVFDLMGRALYIESSKPYLKGMYDVSIQPKLIKGAYIVSIYCNGQVNSSVIVKQ